MTKNLFFDIKIPPVLLKSPTKTNCVFSSPPALKIEPPKDTLGQFWEAPINPTPPRGKTILSNFSAINFIDNIFFLMTVYLSAGEVKT